MLQVVLKGSHRQQYQEVDDNTKEKKLKLHVTHYTKASCNLPNLASYLVLYSYLSLVTLHSEISALEQLQCHHVLP